MDLDDLLELGLLSPLPSSSPPRPLKENGSSRPATSASNLPKFQYLPAPGSPSARRPPPTINLVTTPPQARSARDLPQDSEPESEWQRSDPIVGTREEKAKLRKEKANKKRAITNARKKAHAQEELEAARADSEREAAEAAGAAEAHVQLTQASTEARGSAGEAAVAVLSSTAHQQNIQIASQKVLALLDEYGCSWGEFTLFMSGRQADGNTRYLGFFARPSLVEEVLDLWVSSRNSRTGHETVHNWAVKYVERVVNREANTMTGQGILRTAKARRNLIAKFTSGFSFTDLCSSIMQSCPTMVNVLKSFSSTSHQQKHGSAASLAKKFARLGESLLLLLGERSQQNNYAKHVLSLYLYASGAQRQVISVLSKLGLCSSYTALVGSRSLDSHKSAKNDDDKDRPPIRSLFATMFTDGIVGKSTSTALNSDGFSEFQPSSDMLSASAPSESETASDSEDVSTDFSGSGLSGESSPDSDMMDEDPELAKKLLEYVEKRAAAIRAVLNGTHGLFTVRTATHVKMKTLRQGYHLVGAVQRTRVRKLARTYELGHVYDNYNIFYKAAEQIIGRKDTLERFERFRENVMKAVPQSSQTIPVHQTEVFPLPAMSIDKSSTTGNADVLDTVYRKLGHHLDSPFFTQFVRIVFGDQLSVTRQRGVTGARIGHDNPQRTHINTVQAPGLFHYLMACASGTLQLHFGDPHLGARDPALLSAHNTLLDNKPIVTSSIPPYRTVTYEQLQVHASEILKRFANPQVVEELRNERMVLERSQRRTTKSSTGTANNDSSTEAQATSSSTTLSNDTHSIPPAANLLSQSNASGISRDSGSDFNPSQSTQTTATAAAQAGDMIFENGVLFNRDALMLYAFTKVIREADSGMILIMLKFYALAYRAMNRPKYSLETLTQLHNLLHIWPKPLRDIIMQNWVVNPTGKPNAFVPVDLMQEHFIYWIKVIYSAQGSNASPKWLEKISPCISILREIATQLNDTLGSRQGNKNQTPQVDNDIRELMKSLRMHRGRTLDGKKAQVPNVAANGVHQVNGPLQSYNESFEPRQAVSRANTPVQDEEGDAVGSEYGSNEEEDGSLHEFDDEVGFLSLTEAAAMDGAQLEELNGDSELDSDSRDSPVRVADSEEYGEIMFSLDREEDVDLEM
ncbi:hypothetical protein K474DRAFT_1674371 [Panus rudis PR-1116 ss-1]|nr:hypothetical protein K474DRAFT_1674371 [Panus rudis PR-1116 ss-1]